MNPVCSNCKFEFNENELYLAIPLSESKEYQCKCGYFITFRNFIHMEKQVKWSTAYKETKEVAHKKETSI